MRPGVAGKHLKVVGKALCEVERQRVVPGIAVGHLCIHAVEGNRHTEASWVALRRGIREQRKSSGETGSLGCTRQKRIGHGTRPGKRWIRSGRAEEVKTGDGCQRSAIQKKKLRWAAAQSPENAGNCGIKSAAGGGRRGRDAGHGGADGKRATYGAAEARQVAIGEIDVEQLGIGGIQVLRPVQMQATGPLVADAEFPGARDLAFDSEIGLVGVTIDKFPAHGKSERENGERESCSNVVLIGEERAGSEGIKTLMVRRVAQG